MFPAYANEGAAQREEREADAFGLADQHDKTLCLDPVIAAEGKQRLVRLGFSHRDAALMGYVAMIFCAATALVGRTQPPALQAGVFATATLVLAVMGLWIDWRWRRMEGRA